MSVAKSAQSQLRKSYVPEGGRQEDGGKKAGLDEEVFVVSGQDIRSSDERGGGWGAVRAVTADIKCLWRHPSCRSLWRHPIYKPEAVRKLAEAKTTYDVTRLSTRLPRRASL